MNYSKGFSLIETIIYITLFGLIVSSLFFIIQFTFDNSNYIESRVLIYEENHFLISKFKWIFNSVYKIIIPSDNNYSDTLSLLKFDGSQIDVRLNKNRIELRDNISHNFVPISSIHTLISDLFFKQIVINNSVVGIELSFYINGVLSSSTFYLR